MLSDQEITLVARAVADSSLGADEVEDVWGVSGSDFDGNDAIRVMIVVKPGAIDRATDQAVGDTLVGINQSLRSRGEERFAYVNYATRDDLAYVGDD